MRLLVFEAEGRSKRPGGACVRGWVDPTAIRFGDQEPDILVQGLNGRRCCGHRYKRLT